jgi:hypothetical protein
MEGDPAVQSGARGSVPESVIARIRRKLEVPDPTEAHAVEGVLAE